MKLRLGKAFTVSVTAATLLAASLSADARAIRIDDESGFGIWTEPVSSSLDSLFVGDIGFNFNFFGTSTDSMTIHSNGSVSFGGAVISPFRDDTETNPFSYSLTREPASPGITNAMRIQWGSTDSTGAASSDNLFQMAIFDLANDVFALEFNYGQITAGSDNSIIGYDNGAGTSTDLLAVLGNILGLGGSLPFADYMGSGGGAVDPNEDFCTTPANILACNNFSNISGQFGPGVGVLPSGDFGAGNFGEFFQLDPSTGVEAQGRYLFLIDNRNGGPVPVPEPGTLWLLGAGLIGLGLSRRRRKVVN